MANTYTQLYIHVVFAVNGRAALIPPAFRNRLHEYIAAVVQNDKHKMLAIYCMPDHAHMLVALNPCISISTLVHDVKQSSTNFINQQRICSSHFNWQRGYGAFSYAKSQLPNVISYVLNQEAHHKASTFKDEYLLLLKEFDIAFNEEYIFQFQ